MVQAIIGAVIPVFQLLLLGVVEVVMVTAHLVNTGTVMIVNMKPMVPEILL